MKFTSSTPFVPGKHAPTVFPRWWHVAEIGRNARVYYSHAKYVLVLIPWVDEGSWWCQAYRVNVDAPDGIAPEPFFSSYDGTDAPPDPMYGVDEALDYFQWCIEDELAAIEARETLAVPAFDEAAEANGAPFTFGGSPVVRADPMDLLSGTSKERPLESDDDLDAAISWERFKKRLDASVGTHTPIAE